MLNPYALPISVLKTAFFIAKDAQVCISTIQRMYSLLKDEPRDDAAEEINSAEQLTGN